jgi:hypothetical protein
MNRDQWRVSMGPEVEGRWTGIPTLFLNQAGSGMDLRAALEKHPELPHVYIASGPLGREQWEPAEIALNAGKMVTLAIPESMVPLIPERLRQECHLQVLLDVNCIDFLKPGDELRVLRAPLDTLSFIVGQGLLSEPVDYNFDREVSLP